MDRWALKHRRKISIAVSFGLHGLLILCVLFAKPAPGSGSGIDGAGTGDGIGQGMGVELVSMAEALPEALTVKTPDPTDLADLSEPSVIEVEQDITMRDDTAIGEVTEIAVSQTAGTGNTGAEGAASGDNSALWKQIEPCWLRVADHEISATMLHVSFSALGNVSRVAEALTRDSDVQSLAVQALAECGPYVTSGNRENIAITFPAHRHP